MFPDPFQNVQLASLCCWSNSFLAIRLSAWMDPEVFLVGLVLDIFVRGHSVLLRAYEVPGLVEPLRAEATLVLEPVKDRLWWPVDGRLWSLYS